MKKTCLALALCAASFAVPAAAQQPVPQQARSQFGIGIAVLPIDGAGFGQTIEVYVPIRIAPNFRLEPSLGVATSNPDGDNNNSSDYTLGLGAFWVKPIAAPVDLYAGGRLKLNFASRETAAGDVSGTDVSLAAALGGEYYLVPQFSVGLEGQLGFYSTGDVNGNESGLFTTGLAFLRLYF